jgi:predicted nucleic acid-binding protein
VRQTLEELTVEGRGLCVSQPVLLELLRQPQGEAVAAEHQTLLGILKLVPADTETFELAAGAMEQLALRGTTAHRLPVVDLLTAALAHQRNLAVTHCDGDYELIAQHSGLKFHTLKIPVPQSAQTHPAARQRELRKNLAQALHQVPHAKAEAFLKQAVEDAQKLAEQ